MKYLVATVALSLIAFGASANAAESAVKTTTSQYSRTKVVAPSQDGQSAIIKERTVQQTTIKASDEPQVEVISSTADGADLQDIAPAAGASSTISPRSNIYDYNAE